MKRKFQVWGLNSQVDHWQGSSKRLAKKIAKRISARPIGWSLNHIVAVRFLNNYGIFNAGCSFEDGKRDHLDWIPARNKRSFSRL